MVTRAQIERLSERVEAVAAAGDKQRIVVVGPDETPEQALQRNGLPASSGLSLHSHGSSPVGRSQVVVTRPQIEKLTARIEALVAAADGDARPVYVWRELEESDEQALARHYSAWPADRAARQTFIISWAG